jgi:D-amino-acid dehydrogenase
VSALFGSPLPIRPGKGYAVDITPPPVSLRGAINLSDAKVAVTPYNGRLRLSGTMEFAGLDEVVNDARVRAIAAAPTAYFPDYVAPSPIPVAGGGMRPMTPDGLPIIGTLPGTDNAYVSSGHGMLGLTLAPGTAHALAARILGGALPPRLLPFGPGRFVRQAKRMPALTPSGVHR